MIRFVEAIVDWGVKILYALTSMAFIVAMCLFLFAGSLTVFYYKLDTTTMTGIIVDKWGCVILDTHIIDQWRFSIFAFGFFYITIFRHIPHINTIAKQFIIMSEFVFSATLLIILGVYFMVIANPYIYLIILDASIALGTLGIIILAIRYGFHREKNNGTT